MYKKIAREYFTVLQENGVPLTFNGNDEEITTLANAIEMRCSKPVLPNPKESVAIPAIGKTKTAALIFDRVWASPTFNYGTKIPEDVLFFGATEQEVRAAILVLAYEKLTSPPVVPFAHYFGEKDFTVGDIDWFPRRIKNSLNHKYGIKSVPVYASKISCDREYKTGKIKMLLSVIEGLPLVDDNELTWKQVLEFRRDSEAKIKYKRMMNWLDVMISDGKSPAFIEDSIAIKLDDYQWSLKKHGIKSTLGVISSILDPTFIAATSAAVAGVAYAGSPTWAALGGAGLVIGKLAIRISELSLDIADSKKGENSEVAFIHEIQRRFAKKGKRK